MSKGMAVIVAVKNLLKTYPAISAALINFGVFAAGYFGLHITADQLVAAVGVLDVLFGVIVHSNVIPVAKTENTFTVVNPSILSASRGGGPVPTVPNATVPMEGK